MIPVSQIVGAVRKVVTRGPPLAATNLHDTTIGFRDALVAAVNYTVNSDPVGYGALDQFQAKVARVCGSEQALCVSSGTAALHLALMTVGVEAGSEALLPALTFVATANAVCYCNAIPHFVDVRSWDFGINVFKLQRYLSRIAERRDGKTYNKITGRRIAAIIAVDLLGVPCEMTGIRREADRWGLPLIEDAAEALGSVYKNKPCGSNGDVGVISFNNNKIVTTNGGGALLTDDVYTQAKAWELATTARLGHPWLMGNHSRVAWNYRMGNINAAFAMPQIDRLEELISYKIALHNAYIEAGLNVMLEGQFEEPETTRWNRWLIPLQLEPLDNRRDEICAALVAEGIACRSLFTPLHTLPMFAECPRDNVDGAIDIWKHTICLPSSPALGAAL